MQAANLAVTIHSGECQSLTGGSPVFALTSSSSLKEEEAPIKEKYTSWGPLSNDPLIHASKSFILQRNTAGWRPSEGKKSVFLCVCLVTTHDSFHPSNGPVVLNQSINKDQQSLSVLFFPPSLIFSPPPTPTHYTSSHTLRRLRPPPRLWARERSTTNSKLKWVYYNRFSCCHRSLDPSLFNLSNSLLAWSPVKKRLWGLFNRDLNRVSLFFLYRHAG